MEPRRLRVLNENTPLIGESINPSSNSNPTYNLDQVIGNDNTAILELNRNSLKPDNSPDTLIEQTRTEKLKSCLLSKTVINSFLAVGTVVFMVGYQVAIPLYTGAMADPNVAGSDSYIAFILAFMWIPIIFFAQVFFVKFFIDKKISLKPKASWSNICLAGFTMGINGVLLSLSSPPDRTPPQLQALLQTLLIPATVFARFIVMKKGISRAQSACILCLFAGLVICLEPTIFNMNTSGGSTAGQSGWYFTLVFGLSWLPAAFGYVFVEKGQTGSDDSMVYMAWLIVFLYATFLLGTWVDFIPGLGMANNATDFFNKLSKGFTCFYGQDPKCSQVQTTAAMFIGSMVVGNMFNLLLIRYAESAVYSVVVLALVTPLSAIFWTFFSASPYLHWFPVLNTSTIYLFLGLAIMTPSVVMYTIFSSEPLEIEPRIVVVDASKKNEVDGARNTYTSQLRKAHSAPLLEG